jgi:hypothetical protein
MQARHTTDTAGLSAGSFANQTPNLVPDIQFIKRHIPVQRVAELLGIEVVGRFRARCWRPENHSNGDRDPSVSFHAKRNIGKCWVCDSHAWSNIDLVMKIRQCNVREAVQWMAARFYVPEIPHRKHLTGSAVYRSPCRVGIGTRLEYLVRSGVWATELTGAQRNLIVVLNEFADPATGAVEISYAALRRYTGVGSDSTIAKAIKRFKKLHFLEVNSGWSGDELRRCNVYRLDLENPEFLALVNEVYRKHREEIELERAFRKEARSIRKQEREKRRREPVQVILLSNT